MRRLSRHSCEFILHRRNILGFLLAGILIFFPFVIFASNNYDQEIEKFYSINKNYDDLSIEQKIANASEFFLGKPYKLDALGEGFSGEFDQDPLYRTDSFDCMTFVSTVLALAKSENLNKFQFNIKLINYLNGDVSYFNRNHFTNNDWNKNNQSNNFLEDYTPEIVDANGKSVAVLAQTIIDKPSWYLKKKMDSLQLQNRIAIDEKQKLLTKLHNLSSAAKKETSKLYYLPLDELFAEDGTPNNYLFTQIPSPSVIEIVTPNNKSYIKTTGTALDITHMGIALKINNELMLREASSTQKFGTGIIDVPLIEYLRNYINSKTVKGINVEKIM